jgi:hypothetical protein
MILLASILAGLVAGLILARLQRRRWTAPPLRKPGLVIIAFLPQLVILYLLPARGAVPEALAAVALTLSLALLLVFCWFNRRANGVWLLALGLALNLLVISANGGFMPISRQTAARIAPPDKQAALAAVPTGSRVGVKDVLLTPEQTRLVWLSDTLISPAWLPIRGAVSPGDVVIALGAFWLLASSSRAAQASPNKVIIDVKGV